MKRRNLLQMLGLAPAAAIVAPAVAETAFGGNAIPGTIDLQEALDERASQYSELVSFQNALLDQIGGTTQWYNGISDLAPTYQTVRLPYWQNLYKSMT